VPYGKLPGPIRYKRSATNSSKPLSYQQQTLQILLEKNYCESRVSNLVGFFAILAIFITCLACLAGLFCCGATHKGNRNTEKYREPPKTRAAAVTRHVRKVGTSNPSSAAGLQSLPIGTKYKAFKITLLKALLRRPNGYSRGRVKTQRKNAKVGSREGGKSRESGKGNRHAQ